MIVFLPGGSWHAEMRRCWASLCPTIHGETVHSQTCHNWSTCFNFSNQCKYLVDSSVSLYRNPDRRVMPTWHYAIVCQHGNGSVQYLFAVFRLRPSISTSIHCPYHASILKNIDWTEMDWTQIDNSNAARRFAAYSDLATFCRIDKVELCWPQVQYSIQK